VGLETFSLDLLQFWNKFHRNIANHWFNQLLNQLINQLLHYLIIAHI